MPLLRRFCYPNYILFALTLHKRSSRMKPTSGIVCVLMSNDSRLTVTVCYTIRYFFLTSSFASSSATVPAKRMRPLSIT